MNTKRNTEVDYWFREYLKTHQESMTKISNGIEASGRAIENVSEMLGKHDVKVEAQHSAQTEVLKFMSRFVIIVIAILAAALGLKELGNLV